MPEPHATRADAEDAFARHGAFVRALARRLCRDEAAADDLAQDAWSVALTRPDVLVRAARAPGRAGAERGWLARVVQRLAGKEARRDHRRAEREVLAAGDAAREAALGGHTRNGAAPSGSGASDSLERALVLRDVADALVALDEDARRLVLARHFEALELKQLAAREQVAVSTVKLRLAAAYERLRARLDERNGGDRGRWTRALVCATGGAGAPFSPPAQPVQPVPPVPPAHAALRPAARSNPLPLLTTPTSIVAMGLSAKFTVAALVGAAVVTGFALRGGARGGAALSPALGPVPERATQSHDLGEVAAPVARVAAATEAVSEVALATQQPDPARACATFRVVVTDLDGAPVSGVEVLAGPWDAPLNRVGRTDEQGRLALRCALGPEEPRLVYALRVGGALVGGLRAVSLPAGASWTQRVALDASLLGASAGGGSFLVLHSVSASEPPLRAGAKARAPLRMAELDDAQVGSVLGVLGYGAPEAVDEVERPNRTGSIEPRAEPLKEGEVAFGVGQLPRGGRGVKATLTQLQANLERLEREVLAVSFVLQPSQADATVRGVVRDVAGAPAATARVLVRHGAGSAATTDRVVTAADGSFTAQVCAGDVELVVGAGVTPGSSGRVTVSEGEEHTFDLTIDRGLALVGRLYAADRGAAPSDGEAAAPTRDEGAAEPERVGLASWHVEASVAEPGGEWLAIAVADAEGRYVVPHCPANLVSVELLEPQQRIALPAARFDGVAPGGAPWEVTVAAPARCSVQLAVHDERSDAVVVGELRLWDAVARRGGRLSLVDEVGSTIEVDVPPGAWLFQLGSSGAHFGPTKLVQLVEPAGAPGVAPLEPGVYDAGALDAGPTGWLDLPAPPEGVTWRVERLVDGRAPARVFSDVATDVADYPLPPGEYRALARDAEGRGLLAHAFELRPGQHATAPPPLPASPSPSSSAGDAAPGVTSQGDSLEGEDRGDGATLTFGASGGNRGG
ncbi:MAG: sigma-70 family RNA polymerase sigma factor [Planctomycetota bacterium]